MKLKLLAFLVLLCTMSSFAKVPDSTTTNRIGAIGSYDLAYNFGDRVVQPSVGRKWTVGMSLTNKKRQFLVFGAVGLKGFKVNFYTPIFQEAFTRDVQQAYVPIVGTSLDSLIGAKMNSDPEKEEFYGTYGQHLEVGLMLNRKWKPTLSFYAGKEWILLHDNSFKKYTDPINGDISYVSMQNQFYEGKIGCTIPFKSFRGKFFCLNVNLGYKWINYGDFRFNNTPLSDYTQGDLARKYATDGRFTASVSFLIWSNWGHDIWWPR